MTKCLEGLAAPLEWYRQQEQDDATHPLKQAYNGLGYVVFKRTYARNVPGEERTEEWYETVLRVVLGAQDLGADFTPEEAARLFEHIWNGRAFPGGRMLWQLGTHNIQRYGGDSLVNCWYTELRSIADFTWMFERLMLGGGVGFSVQNGDGLGTVDAGAAIRATSGTFDVDFVVPDNRRGWAELIYRTLKANFTGQTFTYSTAGVRPAGAPIKTFGGKASGPEPLVDGINKMQEILYEADGRTLTSVEMLDMANILGAIVVSGNVRRSAQIAQGSGHDHAYLQAKRWELGTIPNHRAMSNNSVVVNSKEDFWTLPDEFWQGYDGGGEPYGLLNVDNAVQYGRMGDRHPDHSIVGFNPCAEIALADRESCNLAELVLPKFDSFEQMLDAAKLLYKVQKAVAALPYIDGRSDAITSKNMRLGLGVTGVLEATPEQKGWLDPVYSNLRYYDKVWSKEKGYPESVRLTTVKPSGTLSLLAGVLPGGHPGYARNMVRRIRMAANDPVFYWCQTQGYPWEFVEGFDGTKQADTVVVEFPVELPQTATLAKQLTAIDQLEVVKWLQRDWADNAVSVTVYYRPEEIDDIRAYLSEQWDQFKSLSFMLHADHGFAQAPLEEITKEEYEERMHHLTHADARIYGEALEILDSDCASGACPVR